MHQNFNFFYHRRYCYVAYPGSASASGIRIWNANSGCGSRRPKSCGFMRMRVRNTAGKYGKEKDKKQSGKGIVGTGPRMDPDPSDMDLSLITIIYTLPMESIFNYPIKKKLIFNKYRKLCNSVILYIPIKKLTWKCDKFLR